MAAGLDDLKAMSKCPENTSKFKKKVKQKLTGPQ